MKNRAAVELGRLGGLKTSSAKSVAARRNGQKGGRPRDQDRHIREYLRHDGQHCRVRVTRDGRVLRHGSPDPSDRSMDYWQDMGTREEVLEDIEREAGGVVT